jgi:hypothetical protein
LVRTKPKTWRRLINTTEHIGYNEMEGIGLDSPSNSNAGGDNIGLLFWVLIILNAIFSAGPLLSTTHAKIDFTSDSVNRLFILSTTPVSVYDFLGKERRVLAILKELERKGNGSTKLTAHKSKCTQEGLKSNDQAPAPSLSILEGASRTLVGTYTKYYLDKSYPTLPL